MKAVQFSAIDEVKLIETEEPAIAAETDVKIKVINSGICASDLAGLLGTPLCTNAFLMLIFFGLLLPTGTGALCFGVVMGAITPVIGEKRAAAVSGIVQASAGVGDALMSPGLQALISWKSVRVGMGSFAALMVAIIPVVLWMSKKGMEHELPAEREAQDETMVEIIRAGFRNDTYRKVFLAFCTCGFNMSIIESHLFTQYVSWGIPESASSFIMTIYGIMTMVGAMATGALGLKFRMKNVLSGVYGIRGVISIAMLTLPKSMGLAIVATGLLGMSGDSTVPPTSGLMLREFGAKKLGVLYGTSLVGHQVGALVSSWLGGYCYTHFGNYNLLWMCNLALAIFASTSAFLVREQKT